MASEYLYGTYGQLANSVVSATAEAPSVALYVGTAPVNLVRGYATAGIINTHPTGISTHCQKRLKLISIMQMAMWVPST